MSLCVAWYAAQYGGPACDMSALFVVCSFVLGILGLGKADITQRRMGAS